MIIAYEFDGSNHCVPCTLKKHPDPKRSSDCCGDPIIPVDETDAYVKLDCCEDCGERLANG